MKRFLLFSVVSLLAFASCNKEEGNDDGSWGDNRLPAAEVLKLVEENLFTEEGEPVGVADGPAATNRKVCASSSLEAIILFSSLHEGIEFLLPLEEAGTFSYDYVLKDGKGSMNIKSSNDAECYAVMTLRIPDIPEISQIRFINREAFWNENNSQIPGSADLSQYDLGTSGSIQSMFAKLQLQLAATAKDQALAYMETIEKTQAEQKKVAEFISECRKLQQEAQVNGEATALPEEIQTYMDENGLVYDKTGNDLLMTKDEWNVAIGSLQNHLETLGTDIQSQMVYIQDFMGQYNSYLQGANSAISNANQTLTSIARGQ